MGEPAPTTWPIVSTSPKSNPINTTQSGWLVPDHGTNAGLEEVRTAGVKVVVIDPKTIEGVTQAILKVSQVTGTVKKGDEVVTDLNTVVMNVERRVDSATPVFTFVEIGHDPLRTAGSGTLLDDLITAAGGVNVVTQPGYVDFSLQKLLSDQPAVYLATRTSVGSLSALQKRAGYSALAAVKAHQVFILDDDLVTRPGPRIALGLEEIAKALHPTRMK